MGNLLFMNFDARKSLVARAAKVLVNYGILRGSSCFRRNRPQFVVSDFRIINPEAVAGRMSLE
jgi:uncharacterized protein YbaA (DUF1428 family)